MGCPRAGGLPGPGVQADLDGQGSRALGLVCAVGGWLAASLQLKGRGTSPCERRLRKGPQQSHGSAHGVGSPCSVEALPKQKAGDSIQWAPDALRQWSPTLLAPGWVS